MIGLVNLLPVSGWHSSALVADFPIGVAAALVLPPVETGLVAFIGAIDPKEFHRCIPPHKALFNRSQVALADFAASLLAHQLIPRVHSLAFVLPIGLVVLAGGIYGFYRMLGGTWGAGPPDGDFDSMVKLLYALGIGAC